MSRTLLFAEVPCFYASVERSDDPSLADRPIIVGGDPRKRGLVQGASPEALAAGVKLDMTVPDALKLCPTSRAVRTNMHRYREASRRLFACLRRGFGSLEPFGLNAAYFDLGGGDLGGGNPGGGNLGGSELRGATGTSDAIATRLRDEVEAELGLPLRVGIASGKFLARLAAEEAGTEGIRVLAPDSEVSFLSSLPVTRLEGVGEKTAATLAELGAHQIGQLIEVGRDRLQEVLGTHGLRIYAYAMGLDDRPVRAARHPQSLSREATLGESLDLSVLSAELLDLAQLLDAELRAQGLCAGRVAVKVRLSDRSTTTRSQTLSAPIRAAAEIHAVAERLLARTPAGSRPARGLGVQLGKLQHAADTDRQLDLFRP